MARIVLGVTGGIAAYKSCEVVRLLVKAGHDVLPITTAAARRFVAEATFLALARKDDAPDRYPHLRGCDLLVVAPLTAHTMARLAAGMADDLLTQTALAHGGPLLVAPAMNTSMWDHPATQANLRLLADRGAHVVGPESGELAEGVVGMGRMSEPADIARRVEEILAGALAPGPVPGTARVEPSALRGLSVLVTAGGTREPLDSVRVLGNRSSGRMGVALAAEAHRRGAVVTMLAANLTVPAPDSIDVIAAPTAADLRREALDRSRADVILMAAAVADYRPAVRIDGKRPKDGDVWRVELIPTADVAKALGAARTDRQVLVAFGAESGATGMERKRLMLDEKKVDLVVFNDVAQAGVGFDSDDNEVVILSRTGDQHVSRRSKDAVAVAILDRVEEVLASRREH